MLHWVRGVAVRIQAAARGHLVRAALRPLLPFAKLGRAASEVAFLRALFGRLINMCVFDRVTRKGMPMSDLLKRLGVKTKKAASAQKARAQAARVAAHHGGTNPGRVFDRGGALYLVGGSNGMDPALLRKRLGVHTANILLREVQRGDNESAGSESDSADDESSVEAAHAATLAVLDAKAKSARRATSA